MTFVQFHSVDIEPAGDRVSHVLVINGLPAARFDEIRKALEARRLVIEQAANHRLRATSSKTGQIQ
jgi:hypothetical protein